MTPHSNIPARPLTVSLSAEPRKYPNEFATNRMTDSFNVERATPHPAAKIKPITRDPASKPSHSPAAPRKTKYAPTQQAAYAKKAAPKSR